MTKKSLFLTLMVAVISLSACSDLKNLFKVTVDTSFTVDLPIEVTQQKSSFSGPFPFFASVTFNPLDEPDLADYVDNISSIELTSMSATVKTLSAPFQLVSGLLLVEGANNQSVSWAFTDVSIKDGTALTLANDNGQFDTLTEILNSQVDVTVTFSGLSDIPGISYVLQAVMNAAVIAGL